MHYTLTALSPSMKSIDIMRDSLLALGAPADSITIKNGSSGNSLNHLAVTTDDLEKSECYREALELAGGHEVTSSEESSCDLVPVRSDAEPVPTIQPADVWQESGRWFVQNRADGIAQSFATRDEAIAYSNSAFTDGPTPARAEAERGDLVAIPRVENSATRRR